MTFRPAPARRGRGASRAAAAVALLTLAAGCDRSAEIYDPPRADVLPDEIPRPDAPLEPVDVDFDAPDNLPCAERSVALCEGGTDFPCMPPVFLEPAMRTCFTASDCQVDGWVEVELGDDGCAEELRMEDPEPEYVDCMVEELTRGRCVCGAATLEVYFGLGNDGCAEASD